MKKIESPIDAALRSIEKGLVGKMNDKFPVFQKDGNSTADFRATAVTRVFAFFGYGAKAE